MFLINLYLVASWKIEWSCQIYFLEWRIWNSSWQKQFIRHEINNLMFFWPCIMNWLYIDYKLDALIIIYS